MNKLIMQRLRLTIVVLLTILTSFIPGVLISAGHLQHNDQSATQPVTLADPEHELIQFSAAPQAVQQLLRFALELAGHNLHYQYGSADPKQGGMDCSGTIYYILRHFNLKVPRSSHTLYRWAWQHGHFYPVNAHTLSSFEFSRLKPGDLLFWSGTYQTADRDPNVSHVMIYLGKNQTGQRLMVGASNGRTYKGRRIYGVSVFDFRLPSATSKSRFLGYSCIPGLTCNNAS